MFHTWFEALTRCLLCEQETQESITERFGKAKVGDGDTAERLQRRQQDIFRFQIPMRNIVAVQILQPLIRALTYLDGEQQLEKYEFGFSLWNAPALLNVIKKIAAVDEFHDDVDFVWGLDDVFNVYNVGLTIRRLFGACVRDEPPTGWPLLA